MWPIFRLRERDLACHSKSTAWARNTRRWSRRGRRGKGGGGVREVGADADLLDGTELRMPDLSDHAARPDVRILEDLVERVDGADADVPLAQLLEPLVRGVLFELCSHVFEDLRVLLAVHLLGNEVFAVERLAELGPEPGFDAADAEPLAILRHVNGIVGRAAVEHLDAGLRDHAGGGVLAGGGGG